MLTLWIGLLLVSSARGDDSLRGALEAVQRRQRDLQPTIYLSRPFVIGDGQPEDIGYGYQKSVSPNTAGIFEPVALPSSELGNQDSEERNDIEALEKLMMDYLEEEGSEVGREYGRRYEGANKRSIFREREDAEVPDTVQRLYEAEEKAGQEGPLFIPSSFRERFSDDRKARMQSVRAYPKNWVGLGRAYEERPDEDEDEEYLNVLSSIWDKYRNAEDPEEITESDVEELLEYLTAKEERKRQYGGSYGAGYDFFNSPLAWAKRGGPRQKNLLRDVAFDERYPYRVPQKRFPVAKRSPSHYEGPKKEARTDPKVAQELNDIFSGEQKARNVSTNRTEKADAKPGQKEESGERNTSGEPLEVKKKSVDWSEYFGMDRRRKKSAGPGPEEERLLARYLKAYGLPLEEKEKKAGPEAQKKRPDDMDAKLRTMEDMIVDQAIKYTGAHEGTTDSKEAQAVKDKVMTQLAAAYSLEKMRRALGEFKSSIAAQKNTAPASHYLPLPKLDSQQEKKRVAMKKEKAVIPGGGKFAKKNNEIDNADLETRGDEAMECPVIQDIEMTCIQIGRNSEYMSEFMPLCILHQICSVCMVEGCDSMYLSQARKVCPGPSCYYEVRRALPSLFNPKPPLCDLHFQTCVNRFLQVTDYR